MQYDGMHKCENTFWLVMETNDNYYSNSRVSFPKVIVLIGLRLCTSISFFVVVNNLFF